MPWRKSSYRFHGMALCLDCKATWEVEYEQGDDGTNAVNAKDEQ